MNTYVSPKKGAAPIQETKTNWKYSGGFILNTFGMRQTRKN